MLILSKSSRFAYNQFGVTQVTWVFIDQNVCAYTSLWVRSSQLCLSLYSHTTRLPPQSLTSLFLWTSRSSTIRSAVKEEVSEEWVFSNFALPVANDNCSFADGHGSPHLSANHVLRLFFAIFLWVVTHSCIVLSHIRIMSTESYCILRTFNAADNISEGVRSKWITISWLFAIINKPENIRLLLKPAIKPTHISTKTLQFIHE